MKILLINILQSSDNSRNSPHLGLAYIASYAISAGYSEIEIHECEAKDVFTLIEKARYNVIGFTVIQETLDSIGLISEKIKQKNLNTTIVVGGIYPTFVHYTILEQYPSIDIVVRGEGEITFLEILRSVEYASGFEKIEGISFRDNSGLHVNIDAPLISNLDNIPFPARELLPPLEFYKPYDNNSLKLIASVSSSRGCIYNCSFCAVQSFYKNRSNLRWRGRSSENVAQEIEELITKYKAEHIQFIDDNFLVDIQRAIDIFKETTHKGLKFTFGFATRVDQIIKNEEILPTLREFGCMLIELGVESGSNSMLKRLAKDTTVEQNQMAVDLLLKNNILVRPDFIMWDEESTIENIKQNVDFLIRNDFFIPELIYNYVKLYPGTPLYQKRFGPRIELIHNQDSPYYKFLSPDVNQLWAIISEFRREIQPRITELVKKTNKAILDIKDLSRNISVDQEKTIIELHDLKKESLIHLINLRRVPFDFLEFCLKHEGNELIHIKFDERKLDSLTSRTGELELELFRITDSTHSLKCK